MPSFARVSGAMRSWLLPASYGMDLLRDVRSPQLQKLALAAAKKIGKVEVDHGDTNCKTPDAVLYIEKASKRKSCP